MRHPATGAGWNRSAGRAFFPCAAGGRCDMLRGASFRPPPGGRGLHRFGRLADFLNCSWPIGLYTSTQSFRLAGFTQ